jgi:hypothetical protein
MSSPDFSAALGGWELTMVADKGRERTLVWNRVRTWKERYKRRRGRECSHEFGSERSTVVCH